MKSLEIVGTIQNYHNKNTPKPWQDAGVSELYLIISHYGDGGRMIETKLRKSTFAYIESELMSYHETRREIVRLKTDILYATAPKDQNGGGRGNLPSDPTGQTATLMVTHRKIEQMERITEAIEFIYTQLPKEKQDLIKFRYWTRPQTLTWEGIARKLHTSRVTVFRWRDEIITAIGDRIGLR